MNNICDATENEKAVAAIRHTLVSRNFEHAIDKVRYAQKLNPDNERLGRLRFLLEKFHTDLSGYVDYKNLLLECHRCGQEIK